MTLYIKCTSAFLSEILFYVLRQSLCCLCSSHLSDFSIPATLLSSAFVYLHENLSHSEHATPQWVFFYLFSLVLPLTYLFIFYLISIHVTSSISTFLSWLLRVPRTLFNFIPNITKCFERKYNFQYAMISVASRSAIFSRKNPTIVRCTTIGKLGTYTANITAHEYTNKAPALNFIGGCEGWYGFILFF